MKAIYCFRRLGTSTIGYCTEIIKSHEIIVHIFLSLCLFLSVCFHVKFGYSEKATKLEKIFHEKFDVTE